MLGNPSSKRSYTYPISKPQFTYALSTSHFSLLLCLLIMIHLPQLKIHNKRQVNGSNRESKFNCNIHLGHKNGPHYDEYYSGFQQRTFILSQDHKPLLTGGQNRTCTSMSISLCSKTRCNFSTPLTLSDS